MNVRNGKERIKMPSKNTLMFFVSLLIGCIGVFYSKQYIESEIATYKRSMVVEEQMVEVVVPRRKLTKGDLVVQDDLTLRNIPVQYIDSNSITDTTFEKAVGQRVEFDLDVGRPLLWAHLEGGQTPTFSGKVPTGLRAMTIRVDDISSISGFLQPKDKIDLLLTYGDTSRKQIFPLIENLNVIATGYQTYVEKQNSAHRAFSTITIQVSPEQAKKITLSQQVGKITAMLRNPNDESPLSKEPMSIAQALNLPASVLTEETETMLRKKVNQKPKKLITTSPIEYIIGGM